MGTGADTIQFALTVQSVGSGTITFKETLVAAGDPKAATIPYVLFINGDGSRSPTLAYALTVVDVGVPTISFAATFPDGKFVFSGAPPVCDVSSPFVILPAPVVDQPLPDAFRVSVPAVPDFTWETPMLGNTASLPALHQNIQIIGANVASMGRALDALRKQQQQQKQPNKSPDKNNPAKPSTKPGDFTETRNLRVTSKHRIFNPQDNTQYVDITQIDALTFHNRQGQKLTWIR